MEQEDLEEQAIVLFYKYFSSSSKARAVEKWWEDPSTNVRKLYQWQERTISTISSTSNHEKRKRRLPLVGRILIAPEGINGTLSGNRSDVESYVEKMKDYDGIVGTESADTLEVISLNDDLKIFRDVDYKFSYDVSSKPLFPDMKISIVNEIVSTSRLVDVQDIPLETGRHLTPEEFHDVLEQSLRSDENKKDIALIDVRNTFEHDIGYFVHPKTMSKAMDPQMTTFSSFEKFCEQNANSLKDKKVLMYCTGGIRCEKASVLLKRKGVEDVNQLSGGIHRYLEKYGNAGHFKGLNFTFDKRVAMKPNFAIESDGGNKDSQNTYQVVGRCVECENPFDELCGSRVCTVCRDLVLVCPTCRSNPLLREYHCKRHASWKNAYFSFLEVFEPHELETQSLALKALRDKDPSGISKNMRRTLTRQIEKVESRIRDIQKGNVKVNKDAPRRCRSCQKALGQGCDGKCWGFWREAEVSNDRDMATTREAGKRDSTSSTSKVRGRRAKQKFEAELKFLPPSTASLH